MKDLIKVGEEEADEVGRELRQISQNLALARQGWGISGGPSDLNWFTLVAGLLVFRYTFEWCARCQCRPSPSGYVYYSGGVGSQGDSSTP